MPKTRTSSSRGSGNHRRTALSITLLATSLILVATQVMAFCGFYVAKADADLWNEASQVVIARDGNRTVLTMANDYKGELEEFAIVVPVPVVLTKEQIHVGERALLQHLDAYTAPRLVEYHDSSPCRLAEEKMMRMRASAPTSVADGLGAARAKSLGVTIEAQYTVGEYDILILSAKQSDGLETWLREEGYRLPKGASRALAPYIKQDLKFFVAKVNLEEQTKTGFTYLRPLQMAFESPRFMLPIRLGMLNAKGPQDLLVYVLTKNGRVETTNYRTVRVPSEVEIPTYVKTEFNRFYPAMFETAWNREGQNVVFLEYFWDMGWCDPCAADPLSHDELRKLGVMWLKDPVASPQPGMAPRSRRRPPSRTGNVLVTRLHVRYDSEHFPEDLMFQETRDRKNFQGRYILRHPFTGELNCPGGREYARSVSERREREAKTLANLTGWSMKSIRKSMGASPVSDPKPDPTATPWWKNLWQE